MSKRTWIWPVLSVHFWPGHSLATPKRLPSVERSFFSCVQGKTKWETGEAVRTISSWKFQFQYSKYCMNSVRFMMFSWCFMIMMFHDVSSILFCFFQGLHLFPNHFYLRAPQDHKYQVHPSTKYYPFRDISTLSWAIRPLRFSLGQRPRLEPVASSALAWWRQVQAMVIHMWSYVIIVKLARLCDRPLFHASSHLSHLFF